MPPRLDAHISFVCRDQTHKATTDSVPRPNGNERTWPSKGCTPGQEPRRRPSGSPSLGDRAIRGQQSNCASTLTTLISSTSFQRPPSLFSHIPSLSTHNLLLSTSGFNTIRIVVYYCSFFLTYILFPFSISAFSLCACTLFSTSHPHIWTLHIS